LDKKCNIVIVSFHGGAEGASYQRVVKGSEFFYGENRGNVYEFAHRMIDAGADIIFGHGPHVPRALELYRERLICYSLGNFFTYGRMNISGPNGLAPVVVVNTSTDGRFVSGTIHSFQQTYEGPVRKDPLRQAARKIRELTLLDFPETGPGISDNGDIKPE
ncbi:MAG: CapA family protein, partial [Bacteroidales bacterium]|nr:CapA family protein [Bacteroidales bacterium]